ncbi:MAG: putative metallopeptidase [Nanoarchaeota archaeon]|nr:putative metallopeptidase [Nanoarchaeota archaeon]
MKYDFAPDLQARMEEIVKLLNMDWVDINRVRCFRSYGSSTKRTIARCHTIGKLMQKAMNVKAWYTIEYLEKFNKMSQSEQDKVIIHELMHIPKTFGGGFRQHDFVCDKNVELMHEKLANLREKTVNSHSSSNSLKNWWGH